MFTNVGDPLSSNFPQDAIPEVLKDAPQFEIDNPVGLQKRYLEVKGDPKMTNELMKMLEEVNISEQNALKMLVDLFDWLDKLQPTTERQVGGRLEHMKELLMKNVYESVWNVKGVFIGESGRLSLPLYTFVTCN